MEHAHVVRIQKLAPHPNADRLGITHVGGYQVVFQLGTVSEGQLVGFAPADCIMPDTSDWRAVLGESLRIKKVKLRGIISMGVFFPLPRGDWKEGDSLMTAMGITRHCPELALEIGGLEEACPFNFPKYTDIQSYYYKDNRKILVFEEGVVLTEKIHGANARYVFQNGRLWVGGHNRILRENEANIYWRAAKQADLATNLAEIPGVVVFGEVYGRVQALRYGIENDVAFRAFDAMSLKSEQYLGWEAFKSIEELVPIVPIIYEGPWKEHLLDERNGKTLFPADHAREGFVIKPICERWDPGIGRVILKVVGEDYYSSKNPKKG